MAVVGILGILFQGAADVFKMAFDDDYEPEWEDYLLAALSNPWLLIPFA